eukprot:6447474-Prymnesium_polylepis.1
MFQKDRRFLGKLTKRPNQFLCAPRKLCTPGEPVHGARQSEVATDFFFLADLRMYVLHALGYLNFV